MVESSGEFGVGLCGAVDCSTSVSISLDGEGLEEVAGRDAMAMVNCSTTVVIRAFRSLISFLMDKSSLAYSVVVVVAVGELEWRS